MQRGMPYSIIIHAVVLALVLAYGSFVAPVKVQPRRLISVRLTTLPQPVQAEPAPAVEPPVEPAPKPTPPPPKKEPEPRKVPDKPPDKPVAKPAEKPVEPEPPTTAPDATEATADAAAPADAGETAVTTDEHFPFAWYLNLVKGRISMQWQPKQLGFRSSTERSCIVHFVIDRDGGVTRAAVLQSSGVALFDREAVRAVQATHPLPRLPREYPGRTLGLSVSFVLKSGQ